MQTKPVAKYQSQVRIKTPQGYGGETAFSFPRSSLTRCRVVITQREALLRSGIRSDTNATRHVVEPIGDTTPLAVASVDRTPQGIWSWPMQSSGQLQMLIRSQNPCRKQKKRPANFCLIRGVLQWWSMRKYILKHTQMNNTFDTKIILHNYTLYEESQAILEFFQWT